MTASLRIRSSKADSNTWESFTRSELKLESTSETSYLGCGENNWTVTQWSKVLFSDESKFCISFGNQGHRVWRKSGEAQNPCCLKSSVKFPVSDDLGCHVICWCWSTVFSEVHSQRSHLPGNFSARHASFCFELGTCPHCQRYQKLVQ